jgi:hypothetical protein
MISSLNNNPVFDVANYHTNGYFSFTLIDGTFQANDLPGVFKCRMVYGLLSFYVRPIGWFYYNGRLWFQCVRPDDERLHYGWDDDSSIFYFLPETQVQAYYYPDGLERHLRK